MLLDVFYRRQSRASNQSGCAPARLCCAVLLAALCALQSACQSESAGPTPRPPSANSQTLAQKKLLDIVREQDAFVGWYMRGNAGSHEVPSRMRRIQTLWDDYFLGQPRDVEAMIICGKFRRLTGSPEAAYKIFQHADGINPNIAVVKQQLATYEGESGSYAKALENMKLAVSLAPEEPVYHSQLGQLLLPHRKDYITDKIMTQAQIDVLFMESFRRASQLAPENMEYKWRYAQAFYDAGRADWASSLKVWDELLDAAAIGIERDTVNANRARVLIELGRDAEAQALLEKIDNPNLLDAKQKLLKVIEDAKREHGAHSAVLRELSKRPQGAQKAENPCAESKPPLEPQEYSF